MKTIEEKLEVVSTIAHELNKRQIVWAVGASLLLYFKNKVSDFNDIDIMVSEDDVAALKEALLPIGELAPPKPNAQYKTKHFLEFTVNGVDVDVIAGFVIVKDGTDYECPFAAGQIAEYIRVNNETVPLQSLADWRRYYGLMGRTAKAELIDRSSPDGSFGLDKEK